MRLLITGGCGFIGSNLTSRALSEGYETVVFDNLQRPGAIENLAWLRGLGLNDFRHGDIRNPNDVEQVIASFQPEAIFHLAGQVAMAASIENPRGDFEINALGTLNVLESVRRHVRDSPVLYSSTNKVYGDLSQFRHEEGATRYVCPDRPAGFDENIALDFHSPYGCSKGAAEQYVLDYARIYGLRTVVFRHSSMYGPRQCGTFDQGWVAWFCAKALEQKLDTAAPAFTIAGDGKQVRDVLHADDVTDLYFSTLAAIDKTAGKAFNVGGGLVNSLSLLELFAFLEGRLELKLRYRATPWRSSDQKIFIADIRRISEATGWCPKIGFREGIGAGVEGLAGRKSG
jgi:CDP-paratose 2-epimerase